MNKIKRKCEFVFLKLTLKNKNMTPKEKAKELFESFYKANQPETFDLKPAKKCALIAVDEMINVTNLFYEKLSYPCEVKSDGGWFHWKQELTYLLQVRSELEKL